ncbi:response regulator [Sphingomonas sp.]|uniref:response regulator n=1 Tax=Sphingomonas sp. TaxID=28214 RepID=UPI003AFFC40C
MTSPRSVLVVEDESLIAMMLEDFIDGMGHRVVGVAESAADALARIAEEGEIDLAILDVHLRGGEPCWPVADALADRGIAFVLATGGHTEAPPARHAGAPTLNKPYTLADVERVVGVIG